MTKFFTSALTTAINAWLGLDPESAARLKKLRGKTITIEFLPMHFVFQCAFSEKGVEIFQGEEREAETKIRGTPLQMLGVMINRDQRHKFFAEDLVMEGNAELGQQVVELFDEMDIAWEDYFSKVAGDVPAWHAGRLVRGIRAWADRAVSSLTGNINEYLNEETRWLPAREELADFFNDIDALRMDIDRAEARLQYIAARLKEADESAKETP